MTTPKKILIAIIVFAVAVLIPIGYSKYLDYTITKLDFTFAKDMLVTDKADMKVEFLNYALKGEAPADFDAKVEEIANWSWNALSDITRNYVAPMDIKLDGKVADGKTIFKYYGTVTTKDGQTKDYFDEGVFDFVLDPPGEKLFWDGQK